RTVMTLGMSLALLSGAPAHADWILTPYAGLVFGGDLSDRPDIGDGEGGGQEHGVYGLAFGYMSDSVLGFEIDAAYSPDFFGGSGTIVPDNNLGSLMGNLVLNAPLGGSGRVYLSFGGGLIRSRVNDTNDFFDVGRNDFGVDAGAGVVVPLWSTFGLRGDIRYFRNIGDPEPDNEFDLDFGSFDFWRGTAGLSISF